MQSEKELRSSPLGDEVLLYETPDGQVRVDVRLDHDTVWLTQEQLSQLFGRERSVITKHVRNVFREGELKSGSVCAKFAHTAADGKTYQVDHYNLDLIISVEYRVKSQRGVQFRQWKKKGSGMVVRFSSWGQGRSSPKPLAPATCPHHSFPVHFLLADLRKTFFCDWLKADNGGNNGE